ncbi:AMP-binding protein [Spirillospora sp. CA-294931]|uniref:AMP-binding protein n=1 Tax=Spirillospora sp. CA-294931 TaxID=3240042 RepID=UPI003D8B7B6A
MRGTLTSAVLSGPPAPVDPPRLEEIVRPFGVTGRGIAFTGGPSRVELSYHDLAVRAVSAAARLREEGVRPGSPVATTLTNDLPSVVTVLAVWMCGATLVSLPPVTRGTRNWHAERFGPALRTMGCAFLIGDEDPFQGASGLRVIPKAALAEAGERRAVVPDARIPETALVQFTSGSVAAPKGVAIGARALAGHVAAIRAAGAFEGGRDRIVSWLPLYHDMGLVAMFLLGLATRTDQVLAPPASFATGPASWLTALARERATATAAPNFAYRLAAAVPYEPGLDLSRMRVAISGGERLDWQALNRFDEVAGPMGFPREALTPAYGLAEGTVGVSYSPVGRGPLRGPGGHVSVGRPLPGLEVRAPGPDAPGPIMLRGDWLFDGYHSGAGFEAFRPGDWFDTGDQGFVHEDELYVLGRRGEVVTVAGRNVFAEDVEAVAHQAGGRLVRCCAAFRDPGASGRFGLMVEADPRLVKGEEAARELARAVHAQVAESLGTRPAPVLVVRLGAIPRTTSGKVQRDLCRSLHRDGLIGRRLITELN